jgi:hypothetical protein
MAYALPVHIIHEIERRWQRRSNARLHAKSGKNSDHGVEHCPLCRARVLIESAIPSNPNSHADHICSACGHAWHNEAY